MSGSNKVCISFDVELWNESEWLKPHITNDMLKNDRFPNSILSILETLKNNNSISTFFVTLEVTKKYPAIIKKVAESGHEIGVHGPKHLKLKDYSVNQFKNDCKEQIELLQKITGKKPIGYRAPHFSVSEKTAWIFPILDELGFKYDSSIFPISMGEYGTSCSLLEQYKIYKNIVEVPISVSTLFGMRIPFAGGLYFRLLPFFTFNFLLRRELRNRDVVLYFHPHELDSNTPKIKSGPVLKRVLKYAGTSSSFTKFLSTVSKFGSVRISDIIVE